MTAENFEKYAQGKLGAYRSEVNAEAIWSSIAGELQPAKKKKGFFWIWMGSGFLGLIVLGLIGSSNLNNPKPVVASASLVLEEDNVPNDDKALEIAKESSTSDEKIINSAISGRSKNTFATQNPNPSSVFENSTAVKNQIKRAHNSEVVLDVASNQDVLIFKHVDVNKPNAEVIMDTTKIELIQEEGFPALLNNAKEPMAELSQETNLNGGTEDITSVMFEKEEEEEEEVEEKFDVINASEKLPVPSFVRDLTFGFGVRGGLSNSIVGFRSFEGGGDTIRDLRNKSETGLETFAVGVEGLVKHDLGFYLSLGADYAKYTRRMDFDEQIITVDSVPGITRIFVNPITMVETYDSGLVARTTTVTTLKEIYNTHEFINIPITVGYSFGYENWSIGLEAGALINISTKLKGIIRDSENTFYDIGKDENKWFKKNVGASFRGALVLGYAFDDSFQIYFGPEFRSLVRLDTEENPVEQDHSNLGFQMGARYYFAY